jgi:hypothetical protein
MLRSPVGRIQPRGLAQRRTLDLFRRSDLSAGVGEWPNRGIGERPSCVNNSLTRVLSPGSTGCQPVVVGSLPTPKGVQ